MNNLLNKQITVSVSFTLKQLLIRTFVFLSVIYCFWEIYWYSVVGLSCIKWHTHIAFPILLFELYCLCLLIAQTLLKKPYSLHQISVVVFNIFLTVFFLELILVIIPINKTRSELNIGSYSSIYRVNNYNIFHTWGKESNMHHLVTEEFDYIRKTNKLGYCDKEWTKNNNAKIRILCSGDSFTEGDGAPTDSCYPTLLQKLLDETYPNKYEVMNAGTCGSDPFYNYKSFSALLYKYNPKLILQTISTHDILVDYSIRGGLERFQSDIVKYTKAPFWEPLYAISYGSRIFFNLFGFNCEDAPKLKSIQKMHNDFTSLFNQYTKEAHRNQCELAICILPMKHEFVDEKYDIDMSFLNGNNTFDLLSIYKDSLHINKNNYQNYYWQKDGHHNSKGYAEMAKAMLCIQKLGKGD